MAQKSFEKEMGGKDLQMPGLVATDQKKKALAPVEGTKSVIIKRYTETEPSEI